MSFSIAMAQRQTRKLVAILAADIAGYSALMGADEERTVRDLKAHQAVVLPMINEFRGRIIDTAGDGILAEFASAVNAVECAVALQKSMAERNAAIEPERRMQFRIGMNLGDVIYDDARLYGDGINIAARLEAIAEPGGICISNKVYDEVKGRIALAWDDLGQRQLKNITQPVRVYCVRLGELLQDVSPMVNGSWLAARAAASPLAKMPIGRVQDNDDHGGIPLRARPRSPLRTFTTCAFTLIIILLFAHYIITVKLDLHTAYLRVFSLAVPALIGYIFSRQSGQGLGAGFLLGGTTGIVSVMGMHAVIAFVDSASIVPSSSLEWQEAMEYVIGITVATVVGGVLARLVRAASSRVSN
jgi:class 3 adenylate cyclase